MNGSDASQDTQGEAGFSRLAKADSHSLVGRLHRYWSCLSLIFAFAVVSAASAAEPASAAEEDDFEDEYADVSTTVSDPFERVNRTLFKFNVTVYNRVLRPFARGYEKVVPAPARRGLKNFFDNAEYPVRLASCVLQGRFDRAGAETGKFALNTTVGLAGFIKVSDHYGVLRVPDEDIGQAFGRWGLGHGPFLILPILGPSSLRDGIGRIGDYYATPWNWKFMDEYDAWVRTTLQVGNAMVDLPPLLDTHDALYRAAVDPYIAFRNGYLQYRDGEVKQ
jgi:phospholipid-binding lipoprotein MlaA